MKKSNFEAEDSALGPGGPGPRVYLLAYAEERNQSDAVIQPNLTSDRLWPIPAAQTSNMTDRSRCKAVRADLR